MEAPIKDFSMEFVTVDIGSLSAFTDKYSNSSPMKSFSRKGPQSAAEKKAAGADAATAYASAGRVHPISVTGHVAAVEEAVSLLPVSTPTSAGEKFRRMGSSGRRAPPLWRDPKKVLFIFAALFSATNTALVPGERLFIHSLSTWSCIGTLILLYLTFSMGKNDFIDHVDAADLVTYSDNKLAKHT